MKKAGAWLDRVASCNSIGMFTREVCLAQPVTIARVWLDILLSLA
jgi:hypothetical protein